MGNRLSSCGPLIRKAYRNEDTPWQNSRKRDGHLLRYVFKNVFFFFSKIHLIVWVTIRLPLIVMILISWILFVWSNGVMVVSAVGYIMTGGRAMI